MSNPFFTDSIPTESNSTPVNSDWKAEPASYNQCFGKKNFTTGKSSGGINRLLRTKQLSQLPIGELRNLAEVITNSFDAATGYFGNLYDPNLKGSPVMTKGQATELMGALLKLPNRPQQNSTIAGSVTTSQQASPAAKPEHVDMDGYRYQQLSTGEMLRFKLTKTGEIDHRSKPEFVK